MTKPTGTSGPEQSSLRSQLVQLIADRNEQRRRRGLPLESYADFGRILAETVEAGRKPYSRQYVSMLRSGALPITAEIAAAVQVPGSMVDGASELQARAHTVTVLAVYDLSPNAVILGRERRCALPGCLVTFVPAHPSRRYCSDECRRLAARRRRTHTP